MSADPITRIDPWVGCVLGCETGIARVLTDRGEVRASYGGRMLGRIARDRSVVAEPGDWVVLRQWPDRRVTIEDVWTATSRLAPVIALRR